MQSLTDRLVAAAFTKTEATTAIEEAVLPWFADFRAQLMAVTETEANNCEDSDQAEFVRRFGDVMIRSVDHIRDTIAGE